MTKRLEISDLVVQHKSRKGIVHAVAGISLEIDAGETLGLVGESGCGKSSLARAVVGLNKVTAGTLSINGEPMNTSRHGAHAREIQMIFQDPYGSLNPRLTVRELVEEPLKVHRLGNKAERAERVTALLDRVGIPDTLHQRLPHQLSGGQRQRVGIARALALEPEIIVCDEPVSALDVSVQAQVLNLLVQLQREQNLSYLFISHDLEVVRYVSNWIAVMYLGKIVEIGPAEQIWKRPLHPYTRALMQTTDNKEMEAGPEVKLNSELPNPLSPPSGCRFRTRCPLAIERCAKDEPLLDDQGSRHQVACHRVTEWSGDTARAA
ncbi:MAG: ATP-binding cassette domain-containing protein [Rhizobiaceae bacterium]|nr:ATP-binding cassette domain-containing protein [Rhizobiaceae bacterium]